MWSLVIAIRTPVKYAVTGDCHQNTCQICGHWSLPSEHLSNMWSLVIAIRTPVKYVVTGHCHQNTYNVSTFYNFSLAD
jgi:hypothetical protein